MRSAGGLLGPKPGVLRIRQILQAGQQPLGQSGPGLGIKLKSGRLKDLLFAGDQFGRSLANIGDFDKDGVSS